MANSDHLDKLSQGPKVWNEWRRENPHIVPDLSQATLGLNQRQFGPSNGGPIDLRAANLERAMLRFATLTEADLEGAQLIGADLMHARLDRAKLIGADLTDALLDHADVTGADLSRAIITGASFVNARNLTQLQIEGAFGDASTMLPASLIPPQSWFPALDDEDAYANYDPDEEDEVDLYEILGLKQSATTEEVRSSYRGLVKKLHPDVNPGDAAAQEQFKQVSTAYRILGDAEKRAAYDKGEIDSEGRVRPEYEAEQQFRRYAYRFYAAAALSVFIALGALAFAWNAVLRNNERATVAVSAPKQNSERLANDRPGQRLATLEGDDAKGVVAAEQAGFGKEDTSKPLPSEVEKGFVVPSAKEFEAAPKVESAPSTNNADNAGPAAGTATPVPASAPTVPDAEPKAVEAARAEPVLPPVPPAPASNETKIAAAEPAATPTEAPAAPAAETNAVEATAGGQASAPPAAEANPQPPQRLALRTEDPAPPLGEDHNSEAAGAPQSPPASSSAPEAEMEAHRTQPNYAALVEPGVGGEAGAGRSDGGDEAGVASQGVPPTGNDTVSSVLRKRAVNQALAKPDPESTGSIDDDGDLRSGGNASAGHHSSTPRGVRASRRRAYGFRRFPRRGGRGYDDTPAYIDEQIVGRRRSSRDLHEERRREAVSDILLGQ